MRVPNVSHSTPAQPWPSMLAGLLAGTYLYAAATPAMSHFYTLPRSLFAGDIPLAVLTLLATAVLFDLRRIRRARETWDEQTGKYEQQVRELLQSKNQLQHKVRKYSDHADKLKLFISDRLLEHIEYDEKFLHFRNIAAEVRHNGVICYDKVLNALHQARQAADQAGAQPVEDALDAMTYLWVLLDLSTTDNIALYIANRLYEYEEQYYQQQLAGESETQATAPDFSPTFSPRHAVVKAMRGFLERDELPAAEVEAATVYHFENARFRLALAPAGALLGEEDYLVLLAENLLNNALFYGEKKRSRNRHARVALQLREDHGRVILSLYNKGPGISEEARAKIFQLGYSTKRVREHNGKGLGLYFVHEIVKGYEGEIEVENVTNREDAYVIRIELADGEKLTEIIETELDERQTPRCRLPQAGESAASREYRFRQPIAGIELTAQSTQQTCAVAPMEDGQDSVILDPQEPDHPRWCLEITAQKTQHKLAFRPLDVSGVRFTVAIPTAESRLDPEYHQMDDAALDDTEQFERQFEGTEAYRG